MEKTHITNSSEETREVAKRLAQEVLKKGAGKTATIFGLIGELGAGKTTFVQGFASCFDIRKSITSPTYVIMKRFTLDNASRGKFINLYHIDCYRIKEPQELMQLGFADINHEPKNVILIEWADQVRNILPANVCWIQMEHLSQDKRRIIIRDRM